MNLRVAKKIMKQHDRPHPFYKIDKAVDKINRYNRRHGINLWWGHVERIKFPFVDAKS